MSNQLYWDHTPAGAVSLYHQQGELLVFFEGDTLGNHYRYFGNISLKQNLELQSVIGTIEYKGLDTDVERLNYQLIGSFEDDSWEVFEGEWHENNEVYEFNAIFESFSCLEHQPKHLRAQWDHPFLAHEEASLSLTATRQQQRSDCLADALLRIQSIQRSIELSYGLPQGSVQLVNPDQKPALVNTNIGKLRECWNIDIKT